MTKIDPMFVPQTPSDLAKALQEPIWRITSGFLYRIMVKKPTGEGTIVPFRPNRVQRRLIESMWHRNLILKARQLGCTTLICILWLDHALFNDNQRCGIIAQDKDAAEAIFADKVKFAYDNLPEPLRQAMPLARERAAELKFAHNNSSVRVATSMRSGTIHRLLVSEFGKIGARYPEKAKEVVTGSLPAVPLEGIAVIESTAEGQSGEFYKLSKEAEKHAQSRKTLSPRDYRFHFFPWWQAPEYRMEPDGVPISPKDLGYFYEIEAKTGTTLTAEQRAWYVATHDSDFSGDASKMWQEYPSTPDEAFQQSTEGTYYAKQLAIARKEGRIGRIPHRSGVPVNTFWDLGKDDFTSIWFHQSAAFQNCFIRSYQNSGEYLPHYAAYLQQMAAEHGYVWGTHYLPHDANHKPLVSRGESAKDQLEKLLPGYSFEVVPVVERRIDGINKVRAVFGSCFFDEANCADGLVSLGSYRKKFNESIGAYTDEHVHDEHSDYADAFRQFAQGYDGARTHILAAEPEWKRKLRAHLHSSSQRNPMTA